MQCGCTHGFVWRLRYSWPSDTASNGAVQNPNLHWGMGFSVARRLDYIPHSHLRNITAATDLILKKQFDVIVFGNVHRGSHTTRKHLLCHLRGVARRVFLFFYLTCSVSQVFRSGRR